ncbi:MAG: hypothetical protein MUC77_02840 [Chromatiaceae bacterium]|jgi:hypothetical protein|nr:hypothetical protein [Chromatiaceae bacterium]
MPGIDPYGYMRDAAGRLDRADATEVERMLDDLEYLYEVMDPELQGLADGLMERLRARLSQLKG